MTGFELFKQYGPWEYTASAEVYWNSLSKEKQDFWNAAAEKLDYRQKLLNICENIIDMSKWEDYPTNNDVYNLMDPEVNQWYKNLKKQDEEWVLYQELKKKYEG